MDIIAEIKKLNFLREQYIVVGGGGLAARGIRETPDIDLVVTPELFEQCRASAEWQEKVRPNGKPGLKKGIVEMYLDVNAGDFNPDVQRLKTNEEIIQGIPFVSLGDLLQFKKAYGRDKDLLDVELIEKYLNQQ